MATMLCILCSLDVASASLKKNFANPIALVFFCYADKEKETEFKFDVDESATKFPAQVAFANVMWKGQVEIIKIRPVFIL